MTAMRTALALAIAALAAPAAAQDQPHFVSAKDLAAKVAKTTDGAVTFTVPTGPGATVVMVRRDRTGEVEVHARLADEFVVQDGTATVLVGGRVEGGRDTAANERRGGEIVGGVRYPLARGDVLWIPAGQPHQVIVPTGGSFTYLVAKYETKQP
jgi:mannose-6-phosphate isomerase-like protein (cupin superfamily)